METQTASANVIAQGHTFVWHEIYAPDLQKSLDFYTKCLGFGTQEFPMGEMGTYHMLTRDGVGVAGVISTNDPNMQGVPPHWSTYISVPNVDEALETCKQHGATLLHGPMDVPTVGRMVLIQDPQGATVWLFTPAM